MRGTGYLNTYAYKAQIYQMRNKESKRILKHLRLCWQCQKDKHTKNGMQRLSGPNMIFVCEECVNLNKAKKEQA
jgi:hypothetical protein